MENTGSLPGDGRGASLTDFDRHSQHRAALARTKAPHPRREGPGPPPAPSHKIFVIGTGRSGTHWLASTLQAHPDIHVTVEAEPIFGWATAMALDPRRKPVLLPQLVQRYRAEHDAVAPRHYGDKSHSNLWHAEELAALLPDAVFIGIERSPYGTIASMLKHGGVLAWHDRWRDFPVPNRFLGITSENQDAYDSLSPTAKCALRWKSHARRMADLRHALGGRLVVVSYEDLILRAAAELSRIDGLLRLATPLTLPAVNRDSLARWRDELSPAMQREIAAITEIEPGSCVCD